MYFLSLEVKGLMFEKVNQVQVFSMLYKKAVVIL